MKAYITTGSTNQVAGPAKEVLIQVNAALTGTISVYDATSGTSNPVAVISNPTVGTLYRYWDFLNGVRVITSTTCDVTVSCR